MCTTVRHDIVCKVGLQVRRGMEWDITPPHIGSKVLLVFIKMM